MSQESSQKVILFLFAAILLSCVAFCSKLLLTDYVQLMILGIIMSILYSTFAKKFGQNYFRMVYIGVAFSFLISIFDKPEFSFSLLVINVILISAFFIWFSTLLSKNLTLKSFSKKFCKKDCYFLFVLLSLGLIFFGIEVAYNFREGKPIFSSNFFYVKFIDYAIIYLLIVKPFYSDEFKEKFRVNFLIFSFLISVAIITITGSAKAFKAYSVVRQIPDFSKTLNDDSYREKLLRVFSLNSKEAFLLYEAGYNAGMKNFKAAKKLLDLTDTYERLTVQEAKLSTALIGKDFDTAINLLEGLPDNYKLKTEGIISNLFISNYIKDNQKLNEPKLHYLGGLLALHCKLPQPAKYYLSKFLQEYPNHANTIYFLNKINKTKDSSGSVYNMPAVGWLKPKSDIKTVIENKNYLTIVYNQHIDGNLWTSKGKYKVSVFARDDGTTLKEAQKSRFDPSCKMRVWVGNSSTDFKVLSENRKFNAYSFEVNISQIPADIIIEFTNDTYDEAKKWDRNLSISYLKFERIE